MKRYLVEHEEWVLAVAGILIFSLIIAFFVWSVASISTTMGSALATPGPNVGKIQFNIENFKALNLRGLGH